MDSGTSKRDTSGRFKKGQGGRPNGSKNKRKTYTPTEFSASVTAAAAVQLEGMMDKALGVIEQQLEDGDARTAIWVVDRCLPSHRHRLSEAIPDANTSSLDGVIATAQIVTQMTAEARLGQEEASRFLTVLTNTAQLMGYLEIGALREMITGFEQQGVQGGGMGAVDLPLWGRLQERVNSREGRADEGATR